MDFGYGEVVVRDGKGGKDRRTPLPGPLSDPFRIHLWRVKALHEHDLRAGFGCVELPQALSRKYPRACRESRKRCAR
ncbi:MAG TPA: hypothetical protein VF240_16815 [Pyrinomonadaceae bacterium]